MIEQLGLAIYTSAKGNGNQEEVKPCYIGRGYGDMSWNAQARESLLRYSFIVADHSRLYLICYCC